MTPVGQMASDGTLRFWFRRPALNGSSQVSDRVRLSKIGRYSHCIACSRAPSTKTELTGSDGASGPREVVGVGRGEGWDVGVELRFSEQTTPPANCGQRQAHVYNRYCDRKRCFIDRLGLENRFEIGKSK